MIGFFVMRLGRLIENVVDLMRRGTK
jgi:hypothetical protein